MAVKVAINGFGRIGRLALRLMANDPEFDVGREIGRASCRERV